jgi:hypothetical protein
MTQQELRQNIKRRRCAHDKREKDLRQRIKVESKVSAGKSQEGKGSTSESLSWRCKPFPWQRIVSRWWDLTFGHVSSK